MAIVSLSHVSKIYKMDGVQVKANDELSLEIEEGEFVAIVGKSGCGKSTLMHLIGCLSTPTSGKILIDGKDTSQLKEDSLARIRNEKVGFIFQTFNLLPKSTALENVALPLIYAKDGSDRSTRAKSILEKLNLSDRAAHKPNQLSGGQQQRVAIARALINNPKIILADEPTGNLDSKSGEEVFAILKELNKEGRTIVLVTHDNELAKRAGRIIRMKDGKIEK